MKQIIFGQLRSFDDLNLTLNKKTIGSPQIKKRQVEIEGADGVLDMTEHFGYVNYSNRILKFEFSKVTPFMDSFSSISDALHGQAMRITIEEDPNYYYYGRLEVSELTNDKNIGKIEITADCDPYKYNQNQTTVVQAVNGSETITLRNSRKRAVPTVTITAAMTISFMGHTYAGSAGTFTLPELELIEGDNVVTVSGTGTITFVYQEGRL